MRLFTRIARDVLHASVGLVQLARDGVALERRRREIDADELDELERLRERVYRLEYEAQVQAQASMIILTERDFVVGQIARAAIGEVPLCLGAVRYACAAHSPCSSCKLASRMRMSQLLLSGKTN